MKRLLTSLFALLALAVLASASSPLQLLLGTGVAARTTYFGNCQTDGSAPIGYLTDWFGVVTFAGTQAVSPATTQKAMEFTCPGSGNQTINSMEFLGWLRIAGGTTRMAIYTYAEVSPDGGTIYDYTLTKVVEHNASVALSGSSGTPAWVGGSTGLSGTTTLIGGHRYIIAVTLNGSGAGYAYTSSTNAITQYSNDYTGGFPSTLSGGSINNSSAPVFRINITGNGTNAPAPTQESFYVNTDASSVGVTGSPTHPYLAAQTAIVARANKTFTAPIYFYCSGTASDTTAVVDSALGQMATASGKGLHYVGDRTAATYDTSKYHLIPTDRTSYHGCINFTHDYVYLDRLQVKQTSNDAGVTNEIMYMTSSVVGSIWISNSIIIAPGGSEANRYCSSSNAAGGLVFWNCLMYGMGTNSSAGANGIKNHGTTSVYNCTIAAGSGDGFDNTDGSTANIFNTYLQGGNGAIVGTGLSTQNITTTATSDTSGTSGLRNVAYTTANFISVTSGSENLSIANGSVLIRAGTSTSGNSPPLNYTTDITGATLSSPPDLGAIKK